MTIYKRTLDESNGIGHAEGEGDYEGGNESQDTEQKAQDVVDAFVNGDGTMQHKAASLQGYELKKLNEACKIVQASTARVIQRVISGEWSRRKSLEKSNPAAAKQEAAERDEISERTGKPKRLPRGKPFGKGKDERRNTSGNGEGGEQGEGEGEGEQERGEGEGEQGEDMQDMSDLGEKEDTSKNDGALESIIRKIARQEDYKVVQAVDANFTAITKELARVKALAAKGGIGGKTKTIFLDKETGKKIEIDGEAHEALEKVLRAVRAGFRNILLSGPSGCGKTLLAVQLNKVLATLGYVDDFDYQPCSVGMPETVFVGRLLPVGENGQWIYVEPPHVRIYTGGGVFLCDELDAADANVLVSCNAAWEENFNRMTLPARIGNTIAYRHPQCIIIAAANTWGSGFDRMYCGRNELDIATLGRFRVQLALDYDRAMEARICSDKDLLNECWRVRDALRAAGLRRVFGTRELDTASIWRAAGMSVKAAVRSTLGDAWSQDELAKVGYSGAKPLGSL